MTTVSDTSPISYLLLIGDIEILPQIFWQVEVPTEVQRELADPAAPQAVREWIAAPPGWLTIHSKLGEQSPSSQAAVMEIEDDSLIVGPVFDRFGFAAAGRSHGAPRRRPA